MSGDAHKSALLWIFKRAEKCTILSTRSSVKVKASVAVARGNGSGVIRR